MTVTARNLGNQMLHLGRWLDSPHTGGAADRNTTDTLDAHGYGSGSQDGPRASEVSRPTESCAIAALTRSEAADAYAYQDARAALAHALTEFVRCVHRMLPTDVKAHSPAGSGDCAACGRYCPGGPDRLRSGMCARDHQAWIRARQKDPSLELPVWRNLRAQTHWVGASEGEVERHQANPIPVSQAIGTMTHIHERLEAS